MSSRLGATDGMTDAEALEFRRQVREALQNKGAELGPHLFNLLQRMAFGQPEKRDPKGKIIQDYVKPDKWALEFLATRVWPEKSANVYSFRMARVKSAADVGRAMDDVLAAAAAGELPFDEAHKMIRALEQRLKAYETGELAEKMAMLQALAEKIAAERGLTAGTMVAGKSNGGKGYAAN